MNMFKVDSANYEEELALVEELMNVDDIDDDDNN